MTEHPASVIRRAAALLKERAETTLHETPWADMPWAVSECAEDDCPCIVYQGEYAADTEPQVPPIRYVADAENPAYAAWIALMHPGLGLAVAAWLDEAAGYVEAYVARELHDFNVHDEPCRCDRAPLDCNRCGCSFPDGCDCWNGTLAVARLILGEPGAAAISGETPYARGKTRQENQGGLA